MTCTSCAMHALHTRLAGWLAGSEADCWVRMQGKTKMYELGPGAQIKAMVKRISPEAWKAMQNIGV